MKNTLEIFDESFKIIKEMLEKSNVYGCNRIARKLTSLGYMARFKEGVFVGEVLEGIFDQLYDVISEYDIDQDELKKILGILIEQSSILNDSLKNSNNEKIYETLKEMRYSVTDFQISKYNTGPSKMHSHFGPIVTRGG